MKYLVEKGADIHVNFDEAFRNGVSSGHLDVVKYLVEKGADIHADFEGALSQSAREGHFDIVKYLVEKGANIPDHVNIFVNCLFEIKLPSIQKNNVIYIIDIFIHK